MLPEVLAASAEFRQINSIREEDKECLSKLLGKMKVNKLMHKPKIEMPVILFGNLLIHAHVMRMTETLTTVRCHTTTNLYCMLNSCVHVSNNELAYFTFTHGVLTAALFPSSALGEEPGRNVGDCPTALRRNGGDCVPAQMATNHLSLHPLQPVSRPRPLDHQ